MERKLTPRIVTEGSGDSDHNLHFSFHDNQPYADGFFNTDAGLSFQAVPNINLTQTTPFHAFHGFPDNSIGSSSLGLPYVSTSDPPMFHRKMLATTPYLIQGESHLKSVPNLPDNLKTPKLETFSEEVADRFNFGSQVSNRALMICNPSLDRIPIRSPVNHVSARNFHLQHDFHVTEPLRGALRQSSSSSSSNTNLPLLNPASMPQSMLARMRRKKISDKTRCLQKLLPVEKKMDIATMLGEAYKYIKFLKAQLSALESMPCESSFTFQRPVDVSGYAGLDRLNRQQLLQVLVNSPVAQTLLYTKECCIVSLEQLILLKQISDQTRGLPQQALLLGC